ncbi:carbohydrate-selective porin OprB [Pseudomonas frederiksbergensis]
MKKKNNAQLICQLSALAMMTMAGSAHAADAFSADSQWMTGDWGGERTRLIEPRYRHQGRLRR